MKENKEKRKIIFNRALVVSEDEYYQADLELDLVETITIPADHGHAEQFRIMSNAEHVFVEIDTFPNHLFEICEHERYKSKGTDIINSIKKHKSVLGHMRTCFDAQKNALRVGSSETPISVGQADFFDEIDEVIELAKASRKRERLPTLQKLKEDSEYFQEIVAEALDNAKRRTALQYYHVIALIKVFDIEIENHVYDMIENMLIEMDRDACRILFNATEEDSILEVSKKVYDKIDCDRGQLVTLR